MKRSYERDPASRVWRRAGDEADFWYSDGPDEEKNIFAAVSSAADISTHSPELAAAAETSWPSRYHLSPERANLLRGLDFSEVKTVLELGCGCGALTRYLGELGLQVTAVEGSTARARIAAERCRDLPDVHVYCDTWQEFTSPKSFDLVLLVGVLEYAPVGADGPDPVGSCLRACRKHLAKEGALVLAIENRLGLKYFAGHLEDHVAFANWGIERLEGSDMPRTFGKRELKSLLEDAGFKRAEFLYPFPDYKLPEILVREAAFEASEFSAADLLFKNVSRSYNGVPSLGFDESLVRYAVEDNGLLGDTANSFLVLATPAKSCRLAPTWLAKQFHFRGTKGWSTILTFSQEAGRIAVRKELDPASSPAPEKSETGPAFTHAGGESEYCPGRLFERGLRVSLARGGGLDDITAWARPWIDYLCRHLVPERPKSLPPEFVDAVPFNFIETEDGDIRPIDLEWIAGSPVPFSWVFIRGLAYSVAASPRKGACIGLRGVELVSAVAKKAGVELGEDDFAEALEWERELQSFAFGAPPGEEPELLLASILAKPLLDNPHFAYEQIRAAERGRIVADGERERAASELAGAHSEIAAAESSAADALARLESSEQIVERLTRESEDKSRRIAHLETMLRRSFARRRRIAISHRALRRTHRALESHNSVLAKAIEDGQEQLEALALLQHEKEQVIERTRHETEARAAENPLRALVRRRRDSSRTAASGKNFVTGNDAQWSPALLSYVRASFFDEAYYKAQFAQPPAWKDDPFYHYLRRGWREGKRPHPLFDTNFYLRQRPDLVVFDYNPLLHFVRHGVGERRNPHPLFDVHFYLSTYRDLLVEDENPLEHFIHYGLSKRLRPCGYFDTGHYLAQRPDLENGGFNPLVHYLLYGWKEGTEPCPLFSGEYFLKTSRSKILPGESPLGVYVQSLAKILGGAGNPHPLFHTDYYYSQSANQEFTRDPLLHFLRLPKTDMRSPCPLFDTKYYLESNPDITRTDLHPFFHYLFAGVAEGRQPHPLFDVHYYSARVRGSTPFSPLVHYFTTPVSERISPHPLFNRRWYQERYQQVLRGNEDPLLHYLQTGQHLGFAPNPNFEPEFYTLKYGDVKQSGLPPFIHYLRFGAREERQIRPAG